jgi:CheY-like chemotaxis protein
MVNGGLGIGLSLVKRLVEMHDGTISAESKGTGQGACFSVRLPLTDKRPAQEEQASVKEHSDGKGALQILVVDDNVPSAQTIGWMLELIGHTPTLAHDGPEAMKLARSLNPDVILLDIGLPGMTGYDVCRALRQEPEFAGTLFVAQTGWGQDKDKNEAFAAGFDHHLVKPVNMQQFTELLTGIAPKARAA